MNPDNSEISLIYVYIGEINIGTIFVRQDGKWCISCPNHAVEQVRYNAGYESRAEAEDFFRFSMPENARSSIFYIERKLRSFFG